MLFYTQILNVLSNEPAPLIFVSPIPSALALTVVRQISLLLSFSVFLPLLFTVLKFSASFLPLVLKFFLILIFFSIFQPGIHLSLFFV